jgi:hypothetical protein
MQWAQEGVSMQIRQGMWVEPRREEDVRHDTRRALVTAIRRPLAEVAWEVGTGVRVSAWPITFLKPAVRQGSGEHAREER